MSLSCLCAFVTLNKRLLTYLIAAKLQMYSFTYDESKTWTIWPNHLSLSEFTSGRSTIIISQIFRYFFDGVRDKVNAIKDHILDQKSTLKNAMEALETALSKYQTTVEVGDDFVR